VNPTTSPSASVAALFREQTFACGGVRLNVAVGPRNGPPLVLLHGVTRGWRDWLPIMRGMFDHWQIFALDLFTRRLRAAPSRTSSTFSTPSHPSTSSHQIRNEDRC